MEASQTLEIQHNSVVRATNYFVSFKHLKGYVCYIFTSLFCMSKREHL